LLGRLLSFGFIFGEGKKPLSLGGVWKDRSYVEGIPGDRNTKAAQSILAERKKVQKFKKNI
jgi:hypothetical protein